MNGIRSSYRLDFRLGSHLGSADPSGARVVIEIRPPRHVVVDGKTGALKAVYR